MSAVASRWKTARTRVRDQGAISTPASPTAATSAEVSRPAGRSIITMLVSGGTTVAARPVDYLGEGTRVRVIFGQSRKMVVERMQRGGRQNSRLAHAAAKSFAHQPTLVHDSPRSGERGTHGSPQAFRERDHHGVGAGGEFAQRRAARRGSIPEPSAIHVDAKPGLTCNIAYRL